MSKKSKKHLYTENQNSDHAPQKMKRKDYERELTKLEGNLGMPI